MKDDKFMELLNLYVDQQIDPADAALLEEEILRHPARQRTYQQYCRMHRACTVVFEQSRTAEGRERIARSTAAARHVDLDHPIRRAWNPLALVSGLGLAAACAAAVFLVQASRPGASSSPLAVVPPPAAPVAVAAVEPARPAAGEVQVVFSPRVAAPLNANLLWLTEPRVSPLMPSPASSIVLDTSSDPQASNPVSLAPLEPATESVGFQFQK